MKRILLIVIALVLIGGGVFLFLRTRSGGGKAVLKVASTPIASVLLDNNVIGKTPFEGEFAAGEYSLKLVPETTVESSVSWEGTVVLNAGLLTYVNRDLADSEITSGGEILVLERVGGNQAKLAVISSPDGAKVTLDGKESGNTPLVIEDVAEGDFDLTVSADGHSARTVKIKTTKGYKLTATMQLASTGGAPEAESPETSPTPDPSSKASPKATPKTSPKASATPAGSPKASGSPQAKASPPAKPYVEILDTPTGFLRVRKEPSTSSEEVTRVNPGEFYPLLEEEGGWYKIEYESGAEGWISGQYAEKFE